MPGPIAHMLNQLRVRLLARIFSMTVGSVHMPALRAG